MPYWKDPIQFTSFKIKLLQYGATSSQTSTEGATSTGATPDGQPAAKQRVVDASLSKLSAGEMQNIERMIRKVSKGKMTRDAGRAFLKMTYGFTDDEIKNFIP
jgi:hypothetical protein